LKVIDLQENEKKSPGKKSALSKGIRSSKHDICLLTDADCQPDDATWIQKMSSIVTDEKEIGLGYGPYYFQKGWLNKFIRFETVYTAIQYFSFAIWKIPYMGVGRNLIYRKSIFIQQNGFKNHEFVASGDDDLFINEVATAHNVGIQLSPESFVSSEGKENIRNYFIQKKRHISTGKHYRLKHQLLLGLLSMSHFMIFLLFIFSLGFNLSTAVYATLLIIRSILVMIVYKKVLKKLGEQELWRWILLLDVSLLLYYILFTPALMLGNTKTWK